MRILRMIANILTVICLTNAISGCGSDDNEPKQEMEKLLVDKQDSVFLDNGKYVAATTEFTDDNYTYEWSVTVDGESNVDGNVRLIENQSSATITFLSSGMYTITLLVYNENEQLVGNFTCEAIVQ